MPKMKVSTLKQSPYAFARPQERVDPTREGVKKAIEEGRFSQKIMDRDYNEVVSEIMNKTKDPAEMDRLMREYHHERIAELVRTQEQWLDKADNWPIQVNQFNQVIAGNHRFRAIRYLGRTDVEVTIVPESKPRPEYALPEIW